MKLTYSHSNVDRTDSLAHKRATIDLNPTISHILSRDLYQRPIESMFREVLINAIDAHREAGQTKPVEIKLPSTFDETFYIRDFGSGIEHDKLMDIYLAYGTSTRRNTNEVHGGLGLGTKSPLAYTSSFSVESYVDGVKNSYLIYYDEDNLPCVDHRSTEPTTELNGLKVLLTMVTSGDAKSFEAAAKVILSRIPSELFIFAGSKSISKNELMLISGYKTGNIILRTGQKGIKILMGYVAYEMDSKAVLDYLSQKPKTFIIQGETKNAHSLLSKTLDNSSVEVCSSIGEYSVHPSREYINVTPRAINKLIQDIQKGLDEIFVTDSDLDIIEDSFKFSITGIISSKYGDKKIRARYITPPSYSYYRSYIPKQLNTYKELILAHSEASSTPKKVAFLSRFDMTDYLGSGRSTYRFPYGYPSNTSILVVDIENTDQVVIDNLRAKFPEQDLTKEIQEWRIEKDQEERDIASASVSYSYRRTRSIAPKLMADVKHNVLLLNTAAKGTRKADWVSIQHNVKSLKALNKDIYYVATAFGSVDKNIDAPIIQRFNEIRDLLPKWKVPIIIGLPASKGTKTIEAAFKPIKDLVQFMNDFIASDYFKRRANIGLAALGLDGNDFLAIKAYGFGDWLYRLTELGEKYSKYSSGGDKTSKINLKAKVLKEDAAIKFPQIDNRFYYYTPVDNKLKLETWVKQVAEYTGNKPTGAKSKK